MFKVEWVADGKVKRHDITLQTSTGVLKCLFIRGTHGEDIIPRRSGSKVLDAVILRSILDDESKPPKNSNRGRYSYG